MICKKRVEILNTRTMQGALGVLTAGRDCGRACSRRSPSANTNPRY